MAATTVESWLTFRPRPQAIFPDTNLLLLWVLALHDPALIPRFKRTSQFVPADGRLLVQILRRFRQLLTTPNVVTETSNLLGQLAEPARTACRGVVRDQLVQLDERYVTSREASADPLYTRPGLTDVGLLHLLNRDTLLLSDDAGLVDSAARRNLPVTNFNHLRRYSGHL